MVPGAVPEEEKMKLMLEKITKSYGKNLALDGFSAELGPGIYALLGPNGSGKSTLMNIITDNIRADSGTITYTDDDGKTEDVIKMGVRFREKLGFMPQYPGMYPNFTVERFLWYVSALRGMERADAAKEIEEVLADVELSDVPKRKIGALSGGMRQRLALAQAVLGGPSILILDEPTAGLDPRQRILVRNFISKIALDKIVMIATHVVSDIEFIARDVIMLKKGVIVDNAPPHELIGKIEGRVFSLDIPVSEAAEAGARYRVTGMVRNEEDADRVTLRILADAKPNGAYPVPPTLEDYYLYVFGDDEVCSKIP